MTMTFMDMGLKFDSLVAPDPDVILPAEDRRIGSLGTFLIKTNVNEIGYRRRDGYNVFPIGKNLARRTR